MTGYCNKCRNYFDYVVKYRQCGIVEIDAHQFYCDDCSNKEVN